MSPKNWGLYYFRAFISAVALFFFSIDHHVLAQTSAPPGIFGDTVYHSVKLTSDIVYGDNFNIYYNLDDTLKLDIYEPDTLVDYLRPLIIYVHGGGFTAGDKTTDKAASFGNYFAKCGYLYASINYRLCIDDPSDTVDNFQCVYMCTQDAKSAVRFFRRYANDYCVDTSKIFMIGTSAGASICLNTAYWDQSEADSIFDTTDFGTLENTSGNEGYSSHPQAVISCWGGMPDTSWLRNETTPNQLFHGTNDPVVPYVWGLAVNGVYLFGSYTIHEASLADNIESYLHPFVGFGHGVSENTPQFDTLIHISSDFFYNHINGGEGSVPCIPTSIAEEEPGSNDLISISTLNHDYFLIRNNQDVAFNGVLKLYTIGGISMHTAPVIIAARSGTGVNCASLAEGWYLAVVENEKCVKVGKILVVR
jgi:hypothetical protein